MEVFKNKYNWKILGIKESTVYEKINKGHDRWKMIKDNLSLFLCY